MKNNGNYKSDIAAVIHISESEVKMIEEGYDYSWYKGNRYKLDSCLYKLGLDVRKGYTLQDISLHINRLGDRVTCGRYYGDERTDKEWIESGLASQEARDKTLNSPLLDDLYRQKGLTVGSQIAGELKDVYTGNSSDMLEMSEEEIKQGELTVFHKNTKRG